jgi:hypothetical protein
VSADPFAPPGGGNFDARTLNGSLLLITPLSHEKDIKTANGLKDAIKANIVVLDGSEAGSEISGGLIFQGRLIGQLKGRIGNGMVLGRLGQGPAEKGKNPPWVLDDPNAGDKDAARAYLAKNPFVQPAVERTPEPAAVAAGNPLRGDYASAPATDEPPF